MEFSPYKMTCQVGSDMRFSTYQTWQFRMEELMGVIDVWCTDVTFWYGFFEDSSNIMMSRHDVPSTLLPTISTFQAI